MWESASKQPCAVLRGFVRQVCASWCSGFVRKSSSHENLEVDVCGSCGKFPSKNLGGFVRVHVAGSCGGTVRTRAVLQMSLDVLTGKSAVSEKAEA